MNTTVRILIACVVSLSCLSARAEAFDLTFTYTSPDYLRPQDPVRFDIGIFGSVFKTVTVVGPGSTASIVVRNALNFPHSVSLYRVPNNFPPLHFDLFRGPGVVSVRKDATELGQLPMVILRGEFPDPGNGAFGITGFFE
jgi:hypothetical protein